MWEDLAFLARLVRRGVRADEDWKSTWQQYCEEWRIPSDLSGIPPKEALTLFVERNVWQLVNKEWAKDLMYKQDGEDDAPPKPAPGSPSYQPPAVTAVAIQAPAEAAPQDDAAPAEAAAASSSASQAPAAEAEASNAAPLGAAPPSAAAAAQPEGAGAPAPGAQNRKPATEAQKTRMCFAFLEGRCMKGRECECAHSERELRTIAQARREYEESWGVPPKRRIQRRQSAEQRPMPHRMDMAPEPQEPGPRMNPMTMMMNPMMGVPMMMNGPMLMGGPVMPVRAEMHAPFPTVPFHQAMPTMPTMMLADFAGAGDMGEKRSKKQKDDRSRSRARRKGKEKEKAKAKKEDRPRRGDAEARPKERDAARPKRPERKVDEEDL